MITIKIIESSALIDLDKAKHLVAVIVFHISEYISSLQAIGHLLFQFISRKILVLTSLVTEKMASDA